MKLRNCFGPKSPRKIPDGIEKETEFFQNPGGQATNLARPAAIGDKITYSCGAVGKALLWKTVQGMFLGAKGA